MEKIWTTDNISIFYRQNNHWWYAVNCWTQSIDYLNKRGICSYCGHQVQENIECPGCSARMTKNGLVIGEAKVTFCGLLPHALWMLHPIHEIDIHIRQCGPPDRFENCDAKISLTDCTAIKKSVIGFVDYGHLEALKLLLSVECNIRFETTL